jgi:hypothetical protein
MRAECGVAHAHRETVRFMRCGKCVFGTECFADGGGRIVCRFDRGGPGSNLDRLPGPQTRDFEGGSDAAYC